MAQQDPLQHYRTPDWLVDKVWELFRHGNIERVLDVCAGTGAIADGFKRVRGNQYRREIPIDCVEVDLSHHPMLREKGYTVVGLDFETFASASIYSHLTLNPPFARGASFVLRAWDSLWEGEIAAIINAETLRNPYTTERKRLAKLVEEHGSAEFFSDAFKGDDVQREAEVEVALVHLKKPADCAEDWIGPIIDGLRVDRTDEGQCDYRMPQELALPNSFVQNQVMTYQLAVKAMRESVKAQAVSSVMRNRIGKTMARLANSSQEEFANERVITGADVRSMLRTGYEDLRDRAWASVLRSTETLSRLSHKVQRQAEGEFASISKLEFTESNVWGFLLGLVQSQPAMQIDCMCDVFDSISRYHAENAVFYRGWLSNSKHRTAGRAVKMTRFILPGHSVESYSRSPQWDTVRLLADFDLVFALLDGVKAPAIPLADVVQQRFDELKRGERVSASYFDLRLYRQIGTLHFYPRRKDLIDRLNRWVGRRRQWLPPEDVTGAETFWKAYTAAESMDREVREAIRKTSGRHWFDDPVREMLCEGREPAEREASTKKVLGAIESVLERHGLLDALTAEETRIQLGGVQGQLLLAA